jgi:hypothetical protein
MDELAVDNKRRIIGEPIRPERVPVGLKAHLGFRVPLWPADESDAAAVVLFDEVNAGLIHALVTFDDDTGQAPMLQADVDDGKIAEMRVKLLHVFGIGVRPDAAAPDEEPLDRPAACQFVDGIGSPARKEN